MSSKKNLSQQSNELDRPYLEKQVKLFLSAESSEQKNDLLYRMGTNADVLITDDVIAISCNGGRLSKEQRARVIKLINREFEVELDNWDDLPPKILCLTPSGVRALYYNRDLENASLGNTNPSSDDLPSIIQNDVPCLDWDSFDSEANFVQILISAGVSQLEATQVVPLLNKYPRSQEEQAIVTQTWQKLCNQTPS